MSKNLDNSLDIQLQGTAGIVTIEAGTTPADYSFILPTTGGLNTDVLTSTGSNNQLAWTTIGSFGGGSVSSVGLTTPSFLNTTGSPVTTTGTLAITYSGTPLPVLNGGTGTTTSTGSGSTVLNDNATLTTNVTLPKSTYINSSSGSVTIIPPSVGSNYNYNLPTTAGTVGQVLTSAGGISTPMTWTTPSSPGTGTVTSVGLTTPSFLTTTGSPITSSGTLALTLSGTALPVTSGGTGTTTSTGTGSTVLNNSPTFTSDITTPHVFVNASTALSLIETVQTTTNNAAFQYYQNTVDGNTAYVGLDGFGLYTILAGATILASGTAKPIILLTNNVEVVRINQLNTSSTSTTTGTLIVKGGIASNETISSASQNIQGASSGTISILPQAAAGTYNFNLPTTAGTAGNK
jgi:hypothetical protein